MAPSLRASPRLGSVAVAWPRRGVVFASLCALGFVNGIVSRVASAIAGDPWGAVFNTFGISALVWVAIGYCIGTMLQSTRDVRHGDLRIGFGALTAFLVPLEPLSWIALTALAFHLLHQAAPSGTDGDSPLYRAAWILLGITGAMFWGGVLLTLMSDVVLQAETAAVSWLVGVPRQGNTLAFADGNGYVWIAASCSSVANVSLVLLCWIMFSQHRRLRWSVVGAGWCLFAVVSVIAINAVRIGMIVLLRDWFDLLHGPVGAFVVGWLIVIVTIAICAAGTSHVARLARR